MKRILSRIVGKSLELSWRLIPRIAATIETRITRLQPMCWGDVRFNDLLSDSLPNYLTKKEQDDKRLVRRLTKDMLLCNHYYGINPEEYLIHKFKEKSVSQRKEYLSKKEKDEAIMLQAGNYCDRAFRELKDKFIFYQLSRKYFRRDACGVSEEKDKDSFINFCARHNVLFIKPIKGRCGKGNRIINLRKEGLNSEQLFAQLVNSGPWIVEELIQQDERMGVWNETSVNTIRIPSFKTNNGIKILHPFIRMGRRGSIVDNGGSGGIMTVIDAESGQICANAKDELGHTFIENPDNGIKFIGWQVPEWQTLLALNKEIHESLPDYHKYIGFDYALTKDHGWVLVEGNWGDFICQQACLERGLKYEFLALLNS